MLLSLSTTVCRVPAPPALLLQRCRELSVDQLTGLALDTRLPLPVQRDLLGHAARRGLPVAEIALPMTSVSGRSVASALSDDRDERQESSRALVETIELAASHGVARVLLHPWSLPLHVSVAAMLRWFARGEALPESDLEAERAEFADAALDRLRSALDPALEAASARAVRLCFAGPAIWPHQLPHTSEVESLQQEYAGAPLCAAHFTDWAHARSVLFGEPEAVERSGDAGIFDQLAVSPGGLILPELNPISSPPTGQDSAVERTPSPPGPLRLADACGTRLRLPLGVGQSDWASALSQRQREAVLAFDEQTTLAEVLQSREAITAL